VVWARRQTKGRGKPGSAWFSPEGGLYFSVILKPRKNPNELATITLAAARAVVSVIKKEAGIEAEIKLPNDVLIGGQKICGILTEKTGDSLIIGIGFNLNTEGFPKELNAISLFLSTGRRFEPEPILQALLSGLKNEYLKYLHNKV
jgi:BirA family transcriptional regulator, biotin operon repressor / biotin---[acetyl-CoA-carboxylase] ligase